MRKTLIIAAALAAFGTAAQAMPEVYGGTNGLAIANGVDSRNGLSINGMGLNGLDTRNGISINGMGLNGLDSKNGAAISNGLPGVIGLIVQEIVMPGQPGLVLAH